MVHFDQVRELVDHDVIHRRLRSLDQPPVEANVPLDVAATPAGACRRKEQPGNRNIEARRVHGDAFREIRFRMAPVPLDHCRLYDRPGMRGGHGDSQLVAVIERGGAGYSVLDQPDLQFATKKADAVALDPRLLAGRIGAPDGQFLQHPFPGFKDDSRDAPLRAAPGRVDGEAVFVHRQHDATALLAALEQVRDLAVTKPDRFGLGNRGDGEEIAYERAFPRRATSVSIQASAFRLTASGARPPD